VCVCVCDRCTVNVKSVLTKSYFSPLQALNIMHSDVNGDDCRRWYFSLYMKMESELVVEGAGTSETWVLFHQATHCDIPEDNNLTKCKIHHNSQSTI